MGALIATRFANSLHGGLLVQRDGVWGRQRPIPAGWLAQATRPPRAKADYGYMWWLSTGRAAIPAAPASAFWAAGFGGNFVYIDREHDLVIVLRRTPDLAGVVTRTLARSSRVKGKAGRAPALLHSFGSLPPSQWIPHWLASVPAISAQRIPIEAVGCNA